MLGSGNFVVMNVEPHFHLTNNIMKKNKLEQINIIVALSQTPLENKMT